MDIKTLSGARLYIEDMDGLTISGSISSPTRITLTDEDSGDILLSSIHYADFSGLITLNLASVIKQLIVPSFPDDEWYSTTEQVLTLSFRVSTISSTSFYTFTLNCFSRDAKTQLSDIDCLDVPMDDMFCIPLAVHTLSTQMSIFMEWGDKRQDLSIENCDSLLLGVSMKNLYINTDANSRPFRILVTSSSGAALRTPIYRPTPGSFELYVFRNRFGALEIFPMGGDLQLTPEYKYETCKIGSMANSTLKSEEHTLTQYTGPLTRKASRVLADMLATGYAFHYVDGDWKRIVITEAKLMLKKADFLHKQSFSFRYADPTEIRNINI